MQMPANPCGIFFFEGVVTGEVFGAQMPDNPRGIFLLEIAATGETFLSFNKIIDELQKKCYT